MSDVQIFMDGLSASMEGDGTAEQYVQSRKNALSRLKEIEETVNAIKVTNIDEYKKAFAFKDALSSLFCYTFNHKSPEFDKVSELEDSLGKKLAKFARSFARVRGETAHLVKYVCHQGGWYYSSHNTQKIIREMLVNNCLFKTEHKDGSAFWCTGLHLAVGDNVFGFDQHTGKQWRLYVKTCVIQAFRCNGHWQTILTEYEKSGVFPRIQNLPDYYYKTDVGDYKNSARIYLSQKEKNTIRKYML